MAEREQATLGGGCFWCLEAVFKRIQGVEEVISGYAGGHVPDPDYRQVCQGTTGHAEVVQLHFDPAVISYRELLEVFFHIHDPTTRNRQGADVGPQYRSIILHHTLEQAEVARSVMEETSARFTDPIVTELKALDTFYPAEPEHYRYYERNPQQAYCRLVIDPKVAAARRHFAHLIAQSPGRHGTDDD